MSNKKQHYPIFNQNDAIRNTQLLIEHLKKTKPKMQNIRIDPNTIVQIKEGRKNINKIIERIQNKPRKITIIEQIEYGHYA